MLVALLEYSKIHEKVYKSVSLEAFKMYYVMRASVPSLHRESTDSLTILSHVPSDISIHHTLLELHYILVCVCVCKSIPHLCVVLAISV